MGWKCEQSGKVSTFLHLLLGFSGDFLDSPVEFSRFYTASAKDLHNPHEGRVRPVGRVVHWPSQMVSSKHPANPS
jgi:hypothetical protein